MKTIRWGIIGCGDVTEVKSGPGFYKNENSALVAVMRRNGKLAEDYAKRHHVQKWYDDAKFILQDAQVDAVYIATPPAYHKEYTLLAAQAGKAVYVEKPMAMNYEECKQMIDACAHYKVPLYVAYYRRALPKFIKIKELVEEGAIGQVRFATMCQYQKPRETDYDKLNPPWRVVPHISGGGKFLDLASHTLDIFDFILGPVKKAAGIAVNQAGIYEAEDMVCGNLMFDSGVTATGLWCFTAFEDIDKNEIVGSEGKITFSTFGSDPVRLTTNDKTQEFYIEHPLHIQMPLIKSMVQELNGEGTCPSTGDSAARTSDVMDRILNDYYKSPL